MQSSLFAAEPAPVQIVADDFPPYNYLENGEVKGVSADIVRAMLDTLDMEAEIRIMPWARAYRFARMQENVLIFTIARSPEREKLFKWIGPLVAYNAVLFRLAERQDIEIHELHQLKDYRIGSTRDDVRTEYLEGQGFSNLMQVRKGELNIDTLLFGRIDLWLENELTAYFLMRKRGFDPHRLLKKAFELDEVKGEGYLAFGQNTPDELVDRFRGALQAIRDNGTYERIVNRYQ